jgi:sec-independent protein translocase protein TatA
MGELSLWHWLIVIGAFVLLFGAARLPQAARSLGQSIRILKAETTALHGDSAKTADQPKATDQVKPAEQRPAVDHAPVAGTATPPATAHATDTPPSAT